MTEAPKPSPLSSPDTWSLVSDNYVLELLPMFELFSRDALGLVSTHAGARVLDVAAGPGTLTVMAAAMGCSVAAIDFSPQMVKNLEARLSRAQLAADVRLGDGQALPWGDAEFDAAFSMFGLMFFPDRAKGFGELLRVLKSGGKAVVSSWAPLQGIFKSIMSAMREVLPEIPFGTGKGPLGDEEELRSELGAAGFADVSITSVTHRLPASSPAEVWAQSQRATAPVVLLKAALGEAKWHAVSAGVIERLEAEFGAGEVVIQTTAYLGCGTKP
jgi:SAM-dependent methyltransferase